MDTGKPHLVFFDLEVVCLAPGRSAIIQIAAIAVDESLSPVEAFEAKVQFKKPRVGRKLLRKNNYHPGVWAKEAQEPRLVARRFSEFLRRHASQKVISAKGEEYFVSKLVAHNASFDGPHLFSWYKSLGDFLPGNRQVLCTMQRAIWHFAESPNPLPPKDFKLATLCKYFGVPLHAASAHEALADVTATVELYRAISLGNETSAFPSGKVPKPSRSVASYHHR